MKPAFATLVLLTGVVMLTGTIAQAQDREDVLARYLRVDIAAKKTQVMASGLLLSPPEEQAFMPVYQHYQVELAQFTDARQALIQQYVKGYKTLNDAQAKELLDRVFELQEQRLSLLRKYATEMQKSLPITLVAKFVQLELQLQRLMDLQVNMDLPPLQ
jgi:hypothetical protein